MTKKDGIQRTAGFQRKSRKRPVDPEAPQAEVHFEQTTRRRRQAGQPLSEATMEVHFEQTTRRRRQAGQPLSEATTDVHSEQTTRRRRQDGQPLSEATMEVHSEQTTRRRRQAGQPLSEATTDVHSEQTTRRRRQDGQPLSDQRDIASVKEQSPTQVLGIEHMSYHTISYVTMLNKLFSKIILFCLIWRIFCRFLSYHNIGHYQSHKASGGSN